MTTASRSTMKPKRIIRRGDVVDASPDALVFSTNENLFLSGGAGLGLLGVHGSVLQQAMDRALAASGRKVAERGSVFEIAPAATWPFRVFAVVAANEFYETSEQDTRRALDWVLSRCSELPEIKNVAITALGTGYGNMEIEDFVSIFCGARLPPSVESFELIIDGELFFKFACKRNEELGEPALVIG